MNSYVVMDISNNKDSIWNLLLFDTKIFIGNKIYVASVFICPFLIGILNIAMFPISDTGAWMFFVSTTIPSLIILINIKYTFRKSSLYNNNSLTKNNTINFYIETFIWYALLFSFFCFTYTISIYLYGQVFGWLISGWIGKEWLSMYPVFSVPIKIWSFFIFYYVLLNFSFYLLISHFTENKKTFLIIILCLVILSIPFGGLVNIELRGWFSEEMRLTYFDSVGNQVNPISAEYAYEFEYLGETYLMIDYDMYDLQTESYLKPINDIAWFIFPWNGIGQYFDNQVINRMAFSTMETVAKNSPGADWNDVEKFNAWRGISDNIFFGMYNKNYDVNNLRAIAFAVYPMIHIFAYNVITFSDKLYKKFIKKV